MAAVLVHIDLDDGTPHAASLLALAAGRHVASSWGATLYAVVIVQATNPIPDTDVDDDFQRTIEVIAAPTVPGLEAVEIELARAGADKIVVATTNAPVVPLWATLGSAWLCVLEHLRPRLVLFGADSPSAAELGPRTGARLGARLLVRARTTGIDDVEIRDRDGGYVRIGDGGAAVAMIGRASPTTPADEDIDLLVLPVPGIPDSRIELVGTTPIELAQSSGAIIALHDELVGDPKIVTAARRLAKLLGGRLVGGAAAVEAGVIADGAIADGTALAPELCVAIGGIELALSGATSVVKIGAPPDKLADGVLAGRADVGTAELVARLERV